MIQVLIASLLISVGFAQTQCSEPSIQMYNTRLSTGLLPTNLFQESLSFGKKAVPVTATVTGTGWTLTTTELVVEVDSSTTTYTGTQGIKGGVAPNSGTITASTPSVNFLVYFTMTGTGTNSIGTAQGVAVISKFQNVSYGFNIIFSDATTYTLTFNSASINVVGAPFTYVYVNYPYTTAELATLLNALNTSGAIQTAINALYSQYTTQITTLINNFNIVNQNNPNMPFTYTSPSMGKQAYTFNVVISEILIQYTTPVGYYIEAQVDVNGLTTPYSCAYPLQKVNEDQVQPGQGELISLDVIINSFNYALQQSYFTTVFQSAIWKVPYFAWITAGLTGAIENATANFPLQTPISGGCQPTSGQFVQVNNAGTAGNSIQFTAAFSCQVTAVDAGTATTIATFVVSFPKLNVGISISNKQASEISFLILPTSTSTITFSTVKNYPLTSQTLIQWYIQQAINNDFLGNTYLMGTIPTQYRQNPSYTFYSGNLLIEDLTE